MPDAGEVLVAGKPVDGESNKRHTRMVFQSYALFPHMTVAENIAITVTLLVTEVDLEGFTVCMMVARFRFVVGSLRPFTMGPRRCLSTAGWSKIRSGQPAPFVDGKRYCRCRAMLRWTSPRSVPRALRDLRGAIGCTCGSTKGGASRWRYDRSIRPTTQQGQASQRGGRAVTDSSANTGVDASERGGVQYDHGC